MSGDDDVAWSLVEQAVQRDRGYDEEAMLVRVVRSYLIRRGLADTLAAFDAETTPRDVADAPRATAACGSDDEGDDDTHNVQQRRRVQWLCLSGQYEAAAAMLPATSVIRLRLLCLAALRGQPSSTAAMLYAAKHVTPLVARCDDPLAAHALQMQFVAAVLNGCVGCEAGGSGDGNACGRQANGHGSRRHDAAAAAVGGGACASGSMLDCSPYDMAREANEVMLRHAQRTHDSSRSRSSTTGPSALNVLLTWAGWLDRVAAPSAA